MCVWVYVFKWEAGLQILTKQDSYITLECFCVVFFRFFLVMVFKFYSTHSMERAMSRVFEDDSPSYKPPVHLAYFKCKNIVLNV